MSNTLNGSCPSGNKLARITSRTSLGANVLSCWWSCDGETAVVMAVMTVASDALFSVPAGGVGAWAWVCELEDCTGDCGGCAEGVGSGWGVGCCSGGVGRLG